MRKVAAISLVWLAGELLHAQDLTPRAYMITPAGSNAVILTYNFSSGSVFTDPTLPVTDFRVHNNAQILSYYRAFKFFGRSANVVGSMPYVVGNFKALIAGAENQAYRSGLADARVRFSVNLRGGPAMTLSQFAEWRERTTLGVSLTAVVPSGQYDAAKAINPGLHRWAVKPELGFSRRYGKWSVDLYGGSWFFAANSRFFPGDNLRTQSPIVAGEVHLVRYFKRTLWVSADANYWTGGRTNINGIGNRDYQRNSRIGGTAAIPLNRRQSIKVSYSQGAYIQIGGDYKSLSTGWQYSWIPGQR